MEPTMEPIWTAPRWLLLAILFACGCGLRSSAVATRPSGHIRDAGLEPDAMLAGVDLNADRVLPSNSGGKTDGSIGGSSDPWGSIDCQGGEQQVNDCIINAPTKSGIPATRSKPTLTYQTCGAQ
jgi:hypothetical protein